MGERVLVTGGAGFIGSNFVHWAKRNRPDWDLHVLDKLTYAGNTRNLEGLDVPLTVCDIADEDGCREVFRSFRPAVVVNFAAESHVDRSITGPGEFIRTNVDGTRALLQLSVESGARRFHQVSTDEVYGDLPLDRPDLKFTEDSPLRPSSPYSASKAAADLLALSWMRTYGLEVTITRSSNNFGRFQHPEKLIPLAVSRIMEGRKVPIYGAGLNVRDWISVEDHCAGVAAAIEKGRPGGVWNLGGGNEVSNIDLVKAIISILGAPADSFEYVLDRKGHDLRYALDSSKAERELGWRPGRDFRSSLAETARWLSSHRDWWS